MYKNLLISLMLSGNLAIPALAGSPAGAVYAMTNDTDVNAVLVYDRYADGSLVFKDSYPTGGKGGFAGDAADALGSEGALVLSEDKRKLYAVNAGSNTISMFQVRSDGLELKQTINSGGEFPVSIALDQDLLYVLSSGGEGSITGFAVNPAGRLHRIPGSTRSLNAGGTNPPSFIKSPAQVSFDPSGHFLVVTLKERNLIDLFAVDKNGIPSASPVENPSSGSTPFGFGFDARGHLIVAEPFGPATPGVGGSGAVSSYSIKEDGTLTPISATVENGQTATCWIVLGPRGRFAYATNNVSNTITGYRIGFNGKLTLLDPDGVTAEDLDRPVDMGVTTDGHYLYTLNAGGGTVAAYQINRFTGALTFLGEVGGLPEDAGAAGLAVR
jgi:6-phosphogluconolactonase (cycloisomerase 2 family)